MRIPRLAGVLLAAAAPFAAEAAPQMLGLTRTLDPTPLCTLSNILIKLIYILSQNTFLFYSQ